MERVFFNSAEIPFDRAVIIKKKNPPKKRYEIRPEYEMGQLYWSCPFGRGDMWTWRKSDDRSRLTVIFFFYHFESFYQLNFINCYNKRKRTHVIFFCGKLSNYEKNDSKYAFQKPSRIRNGTIVSVVTVWTGGTRRKSDDRSKLTVIFFFLLPFPLINET